MSSWASVPTTHRSSRKESGIFRFDLKRSLSRCPDGLRANQNGADFCVTRCVARMVKNGLICDYLG
jgi:hypothetical protein